MNYARIQDIHLRSNLVERWLGLARILVQTASSSHSAEMTLEGLKRFEAVRDFLYSKMRGVQDVMHPQSTCALSAPPRTGSALDAASISELAATLREVAGEMRAIREQFVQSSKDER